MIGRIKKLAKIVYAKIKNPPLLKSWVQKDEIHNLIKRVEKDGKILNIGAKDTLLSENVINLDIFAFPNIDLVADAHCLPFKDQSIDAVIITAVLEIVNEPQKVVKEIHRVLKNDGVILATLPFLQPYHPDPTDCQRFTIEGVERVFCNFRKEKIVCTRGAFGMFVWIFREFLSLILSFNCDELWKIFNIIFGWIFFPFTYLDRILPKYERLYFISSSFLYIGRKKVT